MTNEEKQLLLKDLCARLPYHPIVKIYNDSWEGCKIGEFDNNLYYHHVEAFACDRIEIKPYLRPMSSMTAKELSFYNNHLITTGITILEENLSEYLDWMHSHHFDYRGLIPMGLALEAPEDMYKTQSL